ncbi:MAG: ABC transporter permease [Chromatiales bacterium]|nr:ABC transporter permease [Chromatiales bacterium]
MSQRHSRLPLTVLFSLAWRNLWRHRRRTIITLSSIAIGFALAVLSIGIGDGSHNSMIRNAIKLGEGHITVQPRGYLEAPANYKYVADGTTLAQQIAELKINGSVQPRVSLQVLASTANNSVGAALEGIVSADDPRALMLQPMLVEGRWLHSDDSRGILIGDGMARKLKAKLGSKVVVMAGRQGGDSQAQLGRVSGIFDSKVDELDDFLVISNLGFARLFLEGEGADLTTRPVTRYAIFLNDEAEMTQWKSQLREIIDTRSMVALDWQEMMPQLVQFIVIDDAGNYVILSLILILVVFGIVNTVLMSVLERTREFGLLRALGMSRHHLLLLVFCESLLLSLLAVVIGWVVGGAIHLWFAGHGIDFSALIAEGTAIMGTFMDPIVYTELSSARVLQLTAIIFISTLSSGIYPAIKAARITPVEALRT